MRIGLVVAGGVDESGREKVVPALLWQIERLARRHDVFVYVLRYHPVARTYRLLGATIRDLGRPEGFVRQYAATCAAVRQDGPLDIVHGWWALPSGLVAAAVGRRLHIPSVVTCDSGEFVALRDIGYGSQIRARQRLAVRAATRLATKVIVCTRYQEMLARAHGVAASVIPLGVDRDRFVPGAGPDGPPWRLMNVASLSPVKDQAMLLDAFARVIGQGTDAHLDIVGEDTIRGAIQDLAARRGVSRHVSFHGVIANDQLPSLYQRAHLFVLSSRHEAAGVAVLEAAASRVPTVGTAVGYVADWAPQLAVGVRPGDPAALAGAIEQLLRDSAARARIASAAHDWTLAHDADWTADQLDRLYRDLRTP